MYRGFKTYRHFLNYSLHALSVVICGDDTVIDEELANRNLTSVKDLQLNDAQLIRRQFMEIAKNVSQNHNQLKAAIGLDKMTLPQRNKIIAITKYNFKWSPEAAFSYIAEMFPDYRKRLTLWEVENSKINKLYALLNKKDADKIIKRLEQVEKRNKKVNNEKPG